ncbi:MAG: hypothetical protein ACF8MJ_01555 [Phycisphaerales bacterium JB050]
MSNRAVTDDGLKEAIKTFVSRMDALAWVVPQAILPLALMEGASSFSNAGRMFHENQEERDAIELSAMIASGKFAARVLSAADAVPSAMFTSIVSQFDTLFSCLCHYAAFHRPHIINKEEFKVQRRSLFSMSSVQELQDHIRTNEVDKILRSSRMEQIEWLQPVCPKQFDLKELIADWLVDFEEVTERRNIHVHNGGRVSKQYLDNVSERCECRVGELDKLAEISPKYLRHAHDVLVQVGLIVAFTVWRSISSRDDASVTDRAALSLTYDMFKGGQNDVVANVLGILTERIMVSADENYWLKCVVNRLQALKAAGRTAEYDRVIACKNWETLSTEYQLAYALLSEDFCKATELAGRCIAYDVVQEIDVLEWPLFSKIKRYPAFVALCIDKFGRSPHDARARIREMLIQRDDVNKAMDRLLSFSDHKMVKKVRETLESSSASEPGKDGESDNAGCHGLREA